MELRHLRYFLRIAELSNLTRAAEQVFVTQSTLSHALRQLEDELGTPLFDRVGRSIRLTKAGRLFRDYAERAVNEVGRGITALNEVRGLEGGTLNVGVVPAFAFPLVPRVVASFANLHPKVKVVVQSLRSRALEELLVAGHLDVGVAFHPASRDEIESEYLFDERLVLVVAQSHALADKRSLHIKSLDDVSLALLTPTFTTRKLIDSIFEEAGARLNVMVEMESVEALVAASAMGQLATIVPEHAVSGTSALHAIRLLRPEPIRKAGLLWQKGSNHTRAALTFAQLVREELASLAGN
jgi:LysR family cyn operon transcriptional activator